MVGPGSVPNLDSAVQTGNRSFSVRGTERQSFSGAGCGTLGGQASAGWVSKNKVGRGGVQRCFSNGLTRYVGDCNPSGLQIMGNSG